MRFDYMNYHFYYGGEDTRANRFQVKLNNLLSKFCAWRYGRKNGKRRFFRIY